MTSNCFAKKSTTDVICAQMPEILLLKEIDMIICIGELAENMAAGAKAVLAETAGLSKVYHFATKADFFAEADTLFQKGDAVLVKASNGMKFPEIVEYLKKLNL